MNGSQKCQQMTTRTMKELQINLFNVSYKPIQVPPAGEALVHWINQENRLWIMFLMWLMNPFRYCQQVRFWITGTVKEIGSKSTFSMWLVNPLQVPLAGEILVVHDARAAGQAQGPRSSQQGTLHCLCVLLQAGQQLRHHQGQLNTNTFVPYCKEDSNFVFTKVSETLSFSYPTAKRTTTSCSPRVAKYYRFCIPLRRREQICTKPGQCYTNKFLLHGKEEHCWCPNAKVTATLY